MNQFVRNRNNIERPRADNVHSGFDEAAVKVGFSQISKRRFAHEDNQSTKTASDNATGNPNIKINQRSVEPSQTFLIEDESDGIHCKSATIKNVRPSTRNKNYESEHGQSRLNTSQYLNPECVMPENLSDKEYARFIRDVCEQAYEGITLGDTHFSVEKLKKAEQLLGKQPISKITEFELLFYIYNNITVASYNQSNIEEAQLYAEKSLKNFESLKSIRKPNRPFNFQFFSDQNEYVLHCKKKILAKKYICRTHLQLSIIFSETMRNLEALDHAKKAVKAACNILIDTLILFYYYLYKAQIKPNEGKRDIKSLSFYGHDRTQNSYDFCPIDEQSKKKKNDKLSMLEFSASDIYEDTGSSGTESSFRSNIPEANFTNRYEELAHKFIPILEEVVEKIKPRKFATYRSKRDRLLAYYRHYFEDVEWSAPDLTNLYGGINQSHWLNSTNLLSVMKLGAVSPTKISLENPKLESEIEIDSMIEKITLIATGFYTISTETRFSKERGSMTPNPKPQPVKFLES